MLIANGGKSGKDGGNGCGIDGAVFLNDDDPGAGEPGISNDTVPAVPVVPCVIHRGDVLLLVL